VQSNSDEYSGKTFLGSMTVHITKQEQRKAGSPCMPAWTGKKKIWANPLCRTLFWMVPQHEQATSGPGAWDEARGGGVLLARHELAVQSKIKGRPIDGQGLARVKPSLKADHLTIGEIRTSLCWLCPSPITLSEELGTGTGIVTCYLEGLEMV
jgi:hypothetical protein